MEKGLKPEEVTEKRWIVFSTENLICVFVFIFFTAVYGLTLCPAVFWWDSGELIANVAMLGIPHRPGFPIYVLLGKLFSLLPLWTMAHKVNFLSALFASFSLVVFFKAFTSFIRLFFSEMGKHKGIVLVSGLTFLLSLGFTYSFWIQAVRAEVYSLNILFFSLLLLLVIRYLENKKIKYICLFSFLLGLGLGNHHITLLSTLPALFLFALAYSPERIFNIKRIPYYALFLLWGLSIYLYLPIRTLSHPPLAWGATKSLSASAGSIFALDTLRNFHLDLFSGWELKFSSIFSLFSDQLSPIVFLIGLLGLFVVSRRNPKLLAFLLLLLTGNCAVVIFMTTDFISTNPDLHGYLVFSIFALAFSFGMAVLFVLNYLHGTSSVFRYVGMILLVLISLVPFYRHLPEADLSGNRIAHDYGLSVLFPLDSNSVLFAENVNLNFITRELQYAEGIRRDVTVIDRGLLGYDWYVKQQQRERKNLFSNIPECLIAEPLFEALLKRCNNLNMPTYMEFTERDSKLADHLLPRGYIFKLSEEKVERISKRDLLTQKTWELEGPFDLQDETFHRDWDAQRVFVLSFYRLGLFYESKGMISHALDKLRKVFSIDPDNQELMAKIKDMERLETLSEIPQKNPLTTPEISR
jgi:NADH:ubiquinone oxidoreductase subunit K